MATLEELLAKNQALIDAWTAQYKKPETGYVGGEWLSPPVNEQPPSSDPVSLGFLDGVEIFGGPQYKRPEPSDLVNPYDGNPYVQFANPLALNETRQYGVIQPDGTIKYYTASNKPPKNTWADRLAHIAFTAGFGAIGSALGPVGTAGGAALGKLFTSSAMDDKAFKDALEDAVIAGAATYAGGAAAQGVGSATGSQVAGNAAGTVARTATNAVGNDLAGADVDYGNVLQNMLPSLAVNAGGAALDTYTPSLGTDNTDLGGSNMYDIEDYGNSGDYTYPVDDYGNSGNYTYDPGVTDEQLTNAKLEDYDITGLVSNYTKNPTPTNYSNLFKTLLALSPIVLSAAQSTDNKNLSATTTANNLPAYVQPTAMQMFNDFVDKYYNVSGTGKSQEQRTNEDVAYQQDRSGKYVADSTGAMSDYKNLLSKFLTQADTGTGYYTPVSFGFGGKKMASFVPKPNLSTVDQILGIGKTQAGVNQGLVELANTEAQAHPPNEAANTYQDQLLKTLMPFLGGQTTTTQNASVPSSSFLANILQGSNATANLLNAIYNAYKPQTT